MPGIQFQPSPGPKAGRYWEYPRGDVAGNAFQPSPGPKAGRYTISAIGWVRPS